MKKLLAILLLFPSLAFAQYNAKTGRVQSGSSAGQVPIWSGTQWIPGDPFVQGVIAHDAPAAAINPVLTGFFASAAAPSDVTADNDSVRAWSLRNGSQVMNLATGGTLYDARQIRALSSGTDSVAISGSISNTTFGATQGTSPWVVGQGTATNLKSAAHLYDAAGNGLTSNSTTYTAKFALDANLLGTLGTAFTTAGFVDIKGADGDVFVRQATASNLNATVSQATGTNLHTVVDSGSITATQATGTNLHVVTDATSVTAATLNAETTKVIGTVRNLGNAGGIFDTTQNATVPANALSIGCNFTTSPATITTGNQGAVQCNNEGSILTQLNDGTTLATIIAATNALKTDLSSVAGTATVTAAAGVQKVGIVGNANAAIDAATGAAPPANGTPAPGLGSGATGGLLLNIAVCDSFANVTISTATTTLIVTGVSGRHVRICSMSLVTAAANNVALISGTGATCGTGTTGMTGGTTAATGWNFAANGGLTQGSGLGIINQTNATGDSVCIVTSAATQLSGRLSYAIY